MSIYDKYANDNRHDPVSHNWANHGTMQFVRKKQDWIIYKNVFYGWDNRDYHSYIPDMDLAVGCISP